MKFSLSILLFFFCINSFAIQIFIQKTDGTTFYVDVETYDTIDYVKTIIQSEQSIDPALQILVFNGTQLEDSKSVSESNILAGDTLNLFIATKFVIGDLEYVTTSLSPPLTVKTNSYLGSSTVVTIPTTVSNGGNSYNVTKIGGYTFDSNVLTSVSIPNSITSIGEAAFAFCQLDNITLPNSIKSIGDYAFEENNLIDITIPDSVESIGFGAFIDNKFYSITIPSAVTFIGSSAFNRNNDLRIIYSTSINPASLDINFSTFTDVNKIDLLIPVGSLSTYDNANWKNFKSITEADFLINDIAYQITTNSPNGTVKAIDYTGTETMVIIPNTVNNSTNTYTVTAIADNAFKQNQLTSISIPNTILTIGDEAFASNKLQDIILPNTLTLVGVGAFSNNELTKINLPNTINSIGNSAFNGNPDLETVIAGMLTPPILNDYPSTEYFTDNNNIDLLVPVGSLAAYTSAKWLDFKIISETDFIVDDIAYQILTTTPELTVKAVNYTGSNTTITIPNEVTFNTNTYIVTGIGNSAFKENQLTTISIPKLIENIDDEAFSGNPLTTVVSKNSRPAILPTNAFSSRNTITLTIPIASESTHKNNGWTGFQSYTEEEIAPNFTIGDYEYEVTASSAPFTARLVTYLGSDKVIVIPASVINSVDSYEITAIGDSAFSSLDLMDITIPNSVLRIENYAFSYNLLNSISLPDFLTFIGDYAFDNNNFTTLNIPNTVTSIGEAAFAFNQIDSLSLSNSLITISDYAFEENKLTTVTIPDTVTSIGFGAFIDNLFTSVTIPNSVIFIGSSAFNRNNNLRTVTSTSLNPVSLDPIFSTFTDTSLIDLIIPIGSSANYVAANWVNFKSVSEVDLIGPIITSLSPLDEAISINPTNDLQVNFNENVLKGTGNITIYNIPDNTVQETIDVSSNNVTISGAVATINPTKTLNYDGNYYVQIDETAFKDPVNNYFEGISNTTIWNFETEAATVDTWTGGTNSSWGNAGNWSTGSIPSISDNVVIPENASITASGNISFNNLNLPATSSITISGSITSGGEIIVASSANDSGVLIIDTPTNIKVNYKRGGLLANKWSIVTAPVNGQKIVEFAQNSSNDIRVNTIANPNRYAIGYYNDANTTNKWQYFDANTNSSLTFEKGKSYALSRATDGEVSFIGTLEVNDISTSVIGNEWSIIGNSYTAYYPVNKNGNNSFLNDNSTKLAIPAIYTWDNSQEKYIAITNLVTSAEQFLPPGQGFFIRPNANTTLSFDEDKRSLKPSTGTHLFNKTTQRTPYFQLFADNGNSAVNTDIIFSATATIGFDKDEDIENFNGASFDINSHLVENSDGKNYTIQSLPVSAIEDAVIPLNVRAQKNNQITFSLEKTDFPTDIKVYLEDKKNNNLTRLDEQNTNYTFTASEDLNGIGRFYLHTNTQTLSGNEELLIGISIFYQSDRKALKISGLHGAEASLKVYDVLGKEVFKTNFVGKMKNTIALSKLKSAMYIVKLITEKGRVHKKIFVE